MANGSSRARANKVSEGTNRFEEIRQTNRFEEIRQMIVSHFQEQAGLSGKDARKLADRMVEIAKKSHIETRSLKL